MLEVTRHGAGGRFCVPRKGKGGGAPRSEEDYPNIIEEPLRVIGGKPGRGQGGPKSGGKAGKGGGRAPSGKGGKKRG